jgi:hypothetical protein
MEWVLPFNQISREVRIPLSKKGPQTYLFKPATDRDFTVTHPHGSIREDDYFLGYMIPELGSKVVLQLFSDFSNYLNGNVEDDIYYYEPLIWSETTHDGYRVHLSNPRGQLEMTRRLATKKVPLRYRVLYPLPNVVKIILSTDRFGQNTRGAQPFRGEGAELQYDVLASELGPKNRVWLFFADAENRTVWKRSFDIQH